MPVSTWKDDDYTIELDEEYTAQLNAIVRERYGSSGPRNATHLSALLMCLRREWAKLRIERGELRWPEEGTAHGIPVLWEASDNTILTWSGGLMFEDLVSTGEKQAASAYCWTCDVVTKLANKRKEDPEVERCPVCSSRWLHFTPDYIDDGVIHEAKETRKSQRAGPGNAPWWIEQLRSYYAFLLKAGKTDKDFTRIVTKWLMGTYGSKKKGWRPVPPQAALEAFRIVFDQKKLPAWVAELKRRKGVVEGTEMPPLDFEDSPRYEWGCSTCEVGVLIKCPSYIWDEEGKETYPFAVEMGAEEKADDSTD